MMLRTVVQVNNILGFERTIGGLWRLGSVSVTSVPIISYESFAQYLGVDMSLITSPPRPLPKENLYYWNFDVGYSGEWKCDLNYRQFAIFPFLISNSTDRVRSFSCNFQTMNPFSTALTTKPSATSRTISKLIQQTFREEYWTNVHLL